MLQFNDIHCYVIRTKPTEHFRGVGQYMISCLLQYYHACAIIMNLVYTYIIYIANFNFDDLTVAAGGVMRIAYNKVFSKMDHKQCIFYYEKIIGGSVVHVREEVKVWQF